MAKSSKRSTSSGGSLPLQGPKPAKGSMPSSPIKTNTRNIQGIGPMGPSENIEWSPKPKKAPSKKVPYR